MRLHLTLTPNNKPVDFNYQHKQVGTIHKWLGNNDLHDNISLYSFSWLKGGKKEERQLEFRNGAKFFISFYDTTRLKDIVKGIQENPEVFNGMIVDNIVIQENPIFTFKQKFITESPVFLKHSIDKKSKFYYFSDAESDNMLTMNAMHKLSKAGLSKEGIKVSFDKDYSNAHTKAITFKKIFSKGSICPIIVEGSPEQISFIWDVGIGNSTGIGFGSLSKID